MEIKYSVFISHSSDVKRFIDEMLKSLEGSKIPPKFNKSSKSLAKLYDLYEKHEKDN